MLQPIVRLMTTIETTENGKVNNFCGYNIVAPAAAPIPMVGDDVLLPEKVVLESGFQKNTFTVKKRRFTYNNIPEGVAGLVTLIVE